MDEKLEQVADNIQKGSTWVRLVLMLGFFIALYVVSIVIFFLTATQAFFSIVTGYHNNNLSSLGARLAEYAKQILNFVTYHSEVKPFPFSDFPNIEGIEEEASTQEQATQSSFVEDESSTQQAEPSIEEVGESESKQSQSDEGSREKPAAKHDDSEDPFDDLTFLSR